MKNYYSLSVFFSLFVLVFSSLCFSQTVWKNLNFSAPSSIETLTINTDGDIFLGTNSSGIYRSTDKGSSWTSINNNNLFKYVPAIAISKISSTIVIDAGDAYRSIDNGETWISLGYHTFMNLTCDDKGLYYAGTPINGVNRSTDDGLTWEGVSSGLTQYSIYSVAFGDSNDVYCSSYGNAVYYSSNSGKNWNPIPIVNSQIYVQDVHSLAYYNGTLYAGTGSGLFLSWDKGLHWFPISINSSKSMIRIIKINNYGQIYVATFSQGIYRSTNGGNSWEEFNSGLSQLDVTAMSFSPDGYIYLGTDAGSVYRSQDVMTSIKNKKNISPADYVLNQNYPNPFNPSTMITYQIPQPGNVEIEVFDMLGNEVAVLVNQYQDKGIHKVMFSAQQMTNHKPLSSGVYFYTMNAGGFISTKKFVLLK